MGPQYSQLRVTGSLRNLIATGSGEPNSIEGDEALAQMQATASES